MTTPNYIPGYTPGSGPDAGSPTSGRFFSDFPASTPKFALNDGPRRSEAVETMARLTISVGQRGMQNVLRTLPADVQAAAQTLLFDGNLTATDGFASGIGYFDFLLESLSDPKAEREQAVDTLTDNTVIFYSGQSAPVLSGQGTFLNSYQDDQHVWFQLLYAELLRGSALARRNLIAQLTCDSFIYSGYLTALQTTMQGAIKNGTSFSFMFRVKSIQIASPILYNPTATTSRISSVLFQSSNTGGADDNTRRGAQAAVAPAAPRATPPVVSIYQLANIDARELLIERAAPARTVQAMTDASLASQSAEAAQALSAVPGSGQALNADPVAASGDVRAQMTAAESKMLLTYQQSVETLTPAARTALEDQLIAMAVDANRSGTALISPVSGTVERSSAYADLIARQPPTAVTQDARAGSATGALTAATAGTGAYQDVYRVHDTSLASVQAAQGELTAPPVRPRSRRRPVGLSSP